MKINYGQNEIDIDEIDYGYHHVVGFIGEEPYIIKRATYTGVYYWSSMTLDEGIGNENFIAGLVELEFLKKYNITHIEVFENMIDVFKYVYGLLSNQDSHKIYYEFD